MTSKRRLTVHATDGPGSLSQSPLSPSNALLEPRGDRWLLRGGDETINPHKAPGIVPALENGIAIIAYLNRCAPRAASLAEISSALHISKSHCHSLLKTFTYFEWLQFDGDAKSYRLQSAILSDASSLLNSPIIGVIRPQLTELVERLSLPCVLSEPLSDDSFVVIDRFNAHHIMEVSFPVGHRFSRNAPAQMRAYLAWQTPERIDRWMQDWQGVPYTDASVLNAQALRAEIGATRRRGYSRSVGEFTAGLMAMALPIFDRSGRIAYVFNISSLVGTLLPREEEAAYEMQRSAARIHRAIAANVPPDFPSAEGASLR